METLIPHIIFHEISVKALPGESNEALFLRARPKGYHCIPGDSGGPTMIGVTLGTYTQWVKSQGSRVKSQVTVEDLKNISYSEWLTLLKQEFWNPCKADMIRNKSIAHMLVDWRWVNGPQAVRDMQTAFSLVADGIVGPKTLAALNAPDSETVFNRLKAAREASYRKIVQRRPSQMQFLNGWLNRTADIKFSDIKYKA